MSKPEDIDEHLAVLGQKLIDSLEKFTADGKRHPWESPVFKARYMNPISGTKYTLENAAQFAMLGED